MLALRSDGAVLARCIVPAAPRGGPSSGGAAGTAADGGGGGFEKGGGGGCTPNASDPLDRDAALAGAAADRPAPGSEGGMLGETRARLLNLLQDSPFYDAGALLAAVREVRGGRGG